MLVYVSIFVASDYLFDSPDVPFLDDRQDPFSPILCRSLLLSYIEKWVKFLLVLSFKTL